jgi:REP element-mobilizing transposase RayT
MKRRPQLELDLKMPVRWGGAREGAGRKAAARARVWHRGRPEFSESHPGLVTIRVRRDVPSLRTLRLIREVERSLRAIAKRADFRVVHYSLQHDHVHLLVEAEGAAALSKGMKSLAARLARAVNRVFRRRGAVLDGRYHHRALGTPREVRSALRYVLLNARKHAADRAPAAHDAQVCIDPASSGRWFEGWAECPAPPNDQPAVVAPQTWLLRAGWRRHGLIRSDDVPGDAGRTHGCRESAIRGPGTSSR